MPEQNFRDPLDALRQRLEETRLAAEQLADDVADARTSESAAGDPPPRADQEQLRDDVAAMAGMVQALVDLVPADLREQVYEILRQILLLLRALIDWLVDRLPPVRAGQPVVEDIPLA